MSMFTYNLVSYSAYSSANLFINKISYFFFFSDMTTAQIEAENTQMTNDLYRLLKKYTGLRNLIRDLKVKQFIYLFLLFNNKLIRKKK